MMLAAILLTFAGQSQEDAATKARALVEQLRSDRVEEREKGVRSLRALGKDALPALRKAAQDPDPEVASRAVALIRSIDVREKVRADARETGSVDAASVVDWLISEPGRRILSSDDLGLGNRRIRVAPDMFDRGLSYELAVDLLKTMDIAAAPEPGKPENVHLHYAATASKKALNVYTSAAALPTANEFCTLVLRMNHISPRDAQAALINTVSFPQNCLSAEASGTVILTDYASNLRKLARLVEEMDRPLPASAFRVNVALLVARSEAAEHVPERFRSLKLASATGKNHFVLAAEAFGRVNKPEPRPPGGVLPTKAAEPAATLGLRLGGASALGVEFQVKGGGGPGLAVERLTLASESAKAAPLLQTKLDLPAGAWVVAGAVPGDKEGASLVLLVRADAE